MLKIEFNIIMFSNPFIGEYFWIVTDSHNCSAKGQIDIEAPESTCNASFNFVSSYLQKYRSIEHH